VTSHTEAEFASQPASRRRAVRDIPAGALPAPGEPMHLTRSVILSS
jgi:hypothetical protein